MSLTLYFVRHGRTEMNRLGFLQGQSGHGLLPEGLEDARRAAAALRAKGVSRIYSSDLLRALETARIIRAGLGLRSAIRPSRVLREMDYGRMTGRAVGVVRRLCPRFGKDSRFVFPDGESYLQVQTRALGWVERLLRGKLEGAAVVVSHGGWLRTLFAGLKGVPLNDCLRGTVAHGLAGRLTVSRTQGLRLSVEPGVTIFPE